MTDRDPFDPLERLLDDAFRSRPAPAVTAMSITDVQRRARRRQQRRSGAMLGTLALVGIGGAVALASRDDGHDRTSLTPGDDAGTATTVACFVVPTTVPPTTSPATTLFASSGTYTLVAGDTPIVVATNFGVPLDALNAANANTSGYATFAVGLTIIIPAQIAGTTTTVLFPPGDPCAPSGGSYHCTGPLGTDDAGAQVFAQCTFFPDFLDVTTTTSLGADPQSGSTYPGEFDPTQTAPTTTSVECQTNTSCAIPVTSTTNVESVATSSTAVVPATTTTTTTTTAP